MPLLKKRPFQKAPLPPDLHKKEEVFHCVMTNEIFREYEEYCQRVILCNSMVWTCCFTGKNGLTYSEAIESEQNAQQIIKDFPTELRIPVLFLAHKTQRTSFLDMADDVFMYVKDRYFIGENVDASFIGNKWRESHILQVIAPTEQQIKNTPKNGQSGDRHFQPPASLYRYEVEQLDAEEEDISEVMVVNSDHIKRRKGNFTRDKNKLFLKQFVEFNEQNVVVIKDSVLEDYGINKIKFEQIFDGPLPNFDVSKKLIKSASNGKRTKQETLAQFLSKNNGLHSENSNMLLEQMKKREEEFRQMKETLKQKRAEDKLAERLKRKEENIKISMILKEWYKPKEDLQLEDHKMLPVPAPLQSKVPDKYMGEVLEILEFVHSFSKILYSKDFFPDGLTLDLVERALLQKELEGPLTDIIQMFLTALFSIQNEEATQHPTELENTGDIRGKDVNGNISLAEATKFATKASSWSILHQGLPLHKLPLYSLTTSEILRLHLLASGARINEMGAKWRYQHRGGYTSEDDPGLYLRLKHPHILKALASHNITELSTGDKLKIIHCLINQLLTYADVRDLVEDRQEKSRQSKLDVRAIQIMERRREQELVTAKLRVKKEGRENNNKDVAVDLDRLDREAERKKAQSERKIESLMKQANEHQILLGRDRAYRHYVKLESIPGVFVNFEEENPGVCLDECVKINPELVGADQAVTLAHVRKVYEQMNTSDKENVQNKSTNQEKDNENKAATKVNGLRNSPVSVNQPDALLVCSADPSSCIVHSDRVNKHKWSFFHSQGQIEGLVDSLNKRGIRESELRQTVVNEQDHLLSLVTYTPAIQLNPTVQVIEGEQKVRPQRRSGKPKYEDTNLGYPPEVDSSSVLQCALLDNVLELEEKIFAGNLGSLKVKDRDAWREHLNNRQFDSLEKTLVSRKESLRGSSKVKKEGKSSRPSTPDTLKEYKDPGKFLGSIVELTSNDSEVDFDQLSLQLSDEHKLAVETLAVALVQVGQSVENRYLKKPLGHANMRQEAKKNEEHDVYDRWEQSLLAATSYSQIFLHFSTLDNCIMWSRSALLARCQICRRQTDSENMLLCDNCNKGHHLYCLKPKLTSVPVGDWFCKECQKQKDKEAKLLNPEPKPEPKKRRRIFKEEVSDEESSEHLEENQEEEEVEEEQETVEDLEDVEMTEAGYQEQDMKTEDEESSKIEVCSKCGSGGMLLCCDNCPELYHLECADPPLRRVPRGEWFCHRCKVKKSRENSDTAYLYGIVAQRSGIIYNQRRCAARARHKIHGFAKTLRRIAESEDSDSTNEEASSSRRSTRREVESRDDLPLHNAPLQELLSDVLKQENAWPFIRPVQRTEVPDYYDIITKPMDFGTIKYKLNMGEYKCDADLMVDAALVFENCNTYNNSKDEVYKCGVDLHRYFLSRCRELGLKPPDEIKNEEADDQSCQNEDEEEEVDVDELLEPPESKRMRTN